MTARHEPPPNPIAVAAWVAGTIVVLAVVLLIPVELYVWLILAALVVALMAAISAAFVLGSRLVDSDAERASDADRIVALEDVIASLDQENARLHAARTERDLRAAARETYGLNLPDAERARKLHADRDRPDLRAVPEQRLPVADVAVPIHTAVDDDELTALIRATEEK